MKFNYKNMYNKDNNYKKLLMTFLLILLLKFINIIRFNVINFI